MVKKVVSCLIFICLIARCVFATGAELKSYVGLRFSYFDLPQECATDQMRFNNTEFDDGKAMLYVTEIKCSGQAQLWLLRGVDKSGKTIAYGHSFQINEKKEYVVEDVYIVRPLKKREALLSLGCERNGVASGPEFAFAFAIGMTVPIRDGSKAVIGSRATSISEAWKVNLNTRKFEQIPTKGIICAFWE
jgi:hypothetical protein